jgi:pantoate--beta-alanine ligase
MGALHAGHAALVEKARRECDYVLVSIFVNPTQFNDKNDLLHYPRTPEADAQLLESAGCDVLFMPTVDVIYPTGFDETPLPVSLNGLDTVMEGAHRPGHFAGVMQVVNKLFQAVGSCRAYFGQKDFQQVAVIRHMTAVLQLPVTIVACPIVREVDGLAMSSRNRRLSPEERAAAPLLYKALQLAQRLWPNTPVEEIRQQVTALVETDSRFQLEYFQLVDTHSLQPVDQNQRKAVVTCIAARLGKIRLIDNLVLAE